MTRKQIRAAMRRLKSENDEHEDEIGELNLVPYMDIVTNIIIFLLASVVQNVPFGNINTSAPTISSGGGGAAEEPEKKPLNLTVTAGASGFTVAASGGVMPVIPKLPDGHYDYKALTSRLAEIKALPENQDESKATFNADSQVTYDILVETLDAMREGPDGKALFSDIVFAAGIL